MKKTIVFTGGGTAGHVFPGLAVVDELLRRGDFAVYWIGSKNGIERRIVEERGISYIPVPSGKLRRYFSLKNFTDIFRVLLGILASRRTFKNLKPDLLFSKGGFVSVPPVLAAAGLGIPVVAHESDFDPGLATRIALRKAWMLLTSFESTAEYVARRPGLEIICTGNPVRRDLRNGDPRKGRALIGAGEKEPVLLVMGGSQGARQINGLIESILDKITSRCFCVHQTGSGSGETGKDYAGVSNYLRYEFIGAELPHIFSAADLVICRAGANTLAELSALGKPGILIPLRTGSRGDQVRNARYFAERNAAVLLDGPSSEELLAAVNILLADVKMRNELAEAAAAAMPGQSAEKAAGEILRLLEARDRRD